MPDADGRIRPVVSPGVPWCMVCKLVVCTCPVTPQAEHAACGTPRCCGTC